MKVKRRPNLYWYLLGLCLLILVVAGVSFFITERTLTPRVTRDKLEQTLDAIEARTEERLTLSESQMVREDLLIASEAATRRTLLLGLGISGAAAIVVSLLLARRLSQPLTAMQGVSRDLADEHYGRRLQINGPAEISDLARAMNEMASKLETTEKAAHRAFEQRHSRTEHPPK